MPGIAVFLVDSLVPLVARLGGCNFTIEGRENIPEGPALFAGNHQGDFDALLILFAFKRIPVIIAKKEAAKVPVAHMWMTMIHTIFMDRKDLRQSLQCIKDAGEYLQNGFPVAIFPEGTRSQSPEMGEFKSGAFKAAVKSKVPVVPFAIDGTYKVFEQQRFLKKADVRLRILKPIELDGSEKTQELADTVKQQIQEALDDIRKEVN